jgi:hypothetical protein
MGNPFSPNTEMTAPIEMGSLEAASAHCCKSLYGRSDDKAMSSCAVF